MAGAWGRQVDPLASLHGAMHVPSNLPSSTLSSHLLVAEMSGWSSCSVSQHHARPARREGCGQGRHRGTMAERGGKSYIRAGFNPRLTCLRASPAMSRSSQLLLLADEAEAEGEE